MYLPLFYFLNGVNRHLDDVISLQRQSEASPSFLILEHIIILSYYDRSLKTANLAAIMLWDRSYTTTTVMAGMVYDNSVTSIL